MGIMSYAIRGAKLLPDLLLGTGADVFGAGMRAAGKGSSIWTKVKTGAKTLENANKGSNFFKRTFKELISTPKDLYHGVKSGASIAKTAGKSGIWGGIKGFGSAIAKKMPMIGAVLTVALEAPNIYKAFKEGGVKEGMKEIGGAGIELGAMAAGAAIGSAICPGVGTLIGGIAGSLIGMFARGKTYSEKQAEAQEQEMGQAVVQYTPEEIQALRNVGLTDEEIALAQQNGYTIQDIAEILNRQAQEAAEAEQAAGQQAGTQPATTQPTEQYPSPYPYMPTPYPYMDPLSTYNPFMVNPYIMNMNTMYPYSNPYSNPFNGQAQMMPNYTNDIMMQQLFNNQGYLLNTSM
ncbi:MAG: hypothetical protein ACI37Q_02320 [Candidatus Gastranaerophilaceae bacterium]